MKKKIISDVLWNVSALVLFNGILQCVIYPLLNKNLGADKFGDFLYILAIISVFAPAVGLSNNNTRILESRIEKTCNGDYIISVFSQIIMALLACGMIISSFCSNIIENIFWGLILIVMSFRYYSDVEFRLELNYKKYFSYYLLISLGYIVGTAFSLKSQYWMFGILLGEAAGTISLLFKGKIYSDFKVSNNLGYILKNTWTLFSSYVIYNAILNLDRVMLQNLMESTYVTIYYVATLLGKTVALLVGPLNGIIIGYLSKNNVKITIKHYFKIVAMLIMVSCSIFLALYIVTPVFVRIMYPDIAESVLEISTLGNMSQILGFAASLLLTVLLTFCSNRWQFVIQSVCAVLFIVIGWIGIKINLLNGFSVSCVLVNGIRFAMTIIIGYVLLTKKNRMEVLQ